VKCEEGWGFSKCVNVIHEVITKYRGRQKAEERRRKGRRKSEKIAVFLIHDASGRIEIEPDLKQFSKLGYL
jgi:hypothetical protein